MRSRGKRAGFWLCLLLAAVLGGAVLATERVVGENVVVPRERTVQDDLAAAGSSVLIAAPVQGDVTAAGLNVRLSGPVQQDALLAGADVDVTGPVGDDLRAAGANILVTSRVADNLALAGSEVLLAPDGSVGRDATLLGSVVRVQGDVGRNLALQAGEAEIGGAVEGDVEARVQQLRLLPGARVGGDLVVYSPTPPEIAPGAVVVGDVTHIATQPARRERGFGDWLAGWLVTALWIFVVGAVALAVSQRWPRQVTEEISQRPGPTALVGCLGLIAVPIVLVILTITLIGIPVALILGALAFVALLLTGAVVAYLVGGWLAGRLRHPEWSPYLKLGLGALAVAFLMALPGIGWLFSLAVVVFGFGALLLWAWDRVRRGRAGEPA